MKAVFRRRKSGILWFGLPKNDGRRVAFQRLREWVTNVPDDDQGEEAADKLEHATNLAQTSDSSVYNSPEPEMVMTLNDWLNLGIECQWVRNLCNGENLAEAVGNLPLNPYYPRRTSWTSGRTTQTVWT